MTTEEEVKNTPEIPGLFESRASRDPQYIAYRLKSYADATGKVEQDVVTQLGVSAGTAYLLGATEYPDPEGSDYRERIAELATVHGISFDTLFDILQPHTV